MFSCTSTLLDHTVTQPVSYWFACHVSYKVKYFGEVYSERFHEESRERQCSFMCFAAQSFHEPNQFSAVDRCGLRTQSMKYIVSRRDNSFQSALENQLSRTVFCRQSSYCSFTTFSCEVNGATRRTNWITTEVIICLATTRMKQTTKLLQLTLAGTLN